MYSIGRGCYNTTFIKGGKIFHMEWDLYLKFALNNKGNFSFGVIYDSVEERCYFQLIDYRHTQGLLSWVVVMAPGKSQRQNRAAVLGSDCGTMQTRVKHLTAIPFSPGSGRQEGNDKGVNQFCI